ncbi:winged helix-turn-helix transcriptional regulator [Antrihabitans stalactiti]|uniref:Helix-turn-helix transcriptional regulator n=1 Tax=Antrihabitans stalactiti TaxID=2584121 RepID=A0A848KND5_9NOCA|nr:helix-turn-helix domain-containing protein [Antrihabitans stalactiti]NMN98162.1 helix-turn-helix transcriptional regulator [Antrihabitans stalactiti]
MSAIQLDDVLADRSRWKTSRCSIGKAMEVVGTRSAILILREALYGTTRFDDFAQRVGITQAVAATRLKDLTAAGLLDKQPYQEPGQRTRYEYILTEKGADLLPVVMALMQWGDKHLQGAEGAPLSVVEAATGEPIRVEVRGADGAVTDVSELRLQLPS